MNMPEHPCRYCEHWKPDIGVAVDSESWRVTCVGHQRGECRRYAPTETLQGPYPFDKRAVWPQTTANDYCGEFKLSSLTLNAPYPYPV